MKLKRICPLWGGLLRNLSSGGDYFYVCSDLNNILIGLILEDLYVNKRDNNTRLQSQQELVHKEYI